MRATRTPKLACLAITASILAALVGAAPAAAAAADCQPYGKTPCLLPFPNNLFTQADHTTPTGLRVHLPAARCRSTPRVSGSRSAPYDRDDGFSPGSAMIVHVPGLDNAAAFARTGAVSARGHGAGLRRSASRSS